ncbi:MAG: YebC/PmpR family DNA-binding transcriptional regulator, partial [Verrucomicrobia bacterium]|nr:YebC/PmpR family DNA-binding transcriptional regulator [Verrucomicrobiota bacterium]
IAKEIMIAVKMGSSGDPDMNPRLRMALLKARMASMPRDNIERAIKKASGEGAAVSYEDLVYEVYGPSGVAILIELSTDNRNRTSAEIRAILTRHNGSMATSGAVSRLFQKKGQFIIEREAADEDKLMEVAMNAGAEDFKSEPEGYEIITEPGDFETVSKALDEAGITCANASITQLPTMITSVAPDMVEVVQKLIDALEDQDDVQEVFTNADM